MDKYFLLNYVPVTVTDSQYYSAIDELNEPLWSFILVYYITE